MLRRTQEALCQDKEILASKPLHWSLFDGQYRHVETQRLSLRKEAMAQASGKEQLRRKRRGAALLQSSAQIWSRRWRRRDPIEHDLGIRMILRLGAWAEVKPDVLPRVTGFALQTDSRRRFIGGPNPGKRTLVQALPLDWWKP